MSYVPLNADRLIARFPRGSTVNALDAASSVIPNNQSIVILNWLHIKSGNVVVGGVTGYGINLYNNVATEIMVLAASATTLRARFYSAAYQNIDLPLATMLDRDLLVAIVLDRDNGRSEVWVDGVLIDSAVTTQDPNFSVNNRILLSDGGTHFHTNLVSRGAVLSLTNGQTPTAAQWREYLTAMRSPESAIHAGLSARIGSCYSDFRPGEGVYGSGTVTDNGTSGNHMLWSGGVTIEDVRTRARTPIRTVVQDWYAVKAGYTALAAVQDYGFAVQPVVMRAVCGERSYTPTALNYYCPGIRNAAGTNFVTIEHYTGLRRYRIGAGGAFPPVAQEDMHLTGGDFWIVCDGTTWYVIVNGQRVHTPAALAAAVDLTGNCYAHIKYAIGDRTDVCRIAAWNPATVPATLLDEIRMCVMNPEVDPPSLTNKRVDFPLNETTLPLVTSTTVANQGSGGGSLVISAQRSTSCKTMFAKRA